MSVYTAIDGGSDAYEAVKIDLLNLQKQREALELEAESLSALLNAPGPDGKPPIGIKTPLIDSEGFPLAGYDIFTIRHQRHRLACIQTDHKLLMSKMERALHSLHEIESSRSSVAPEPALISVEKPSQTSERKQTAYDIQNDYPPSRLPFSRVNTVAEGSPAQDSGLKVGDLILSFGPVTYLNHSNLRAIVDTVEKSVGMPLTVWVERNLEPLKISLVPRTWSGPGLLGCHLLPM